MPCGSKPLKKNWDHPRNLRIVKPSRFQQNDPSVKKHWRNITKELELSYKDEKFWETSADIVSEIVGPIIFKRIRNIFGIPEKPLDYEPKSETSSLVPSAKFYKFFSTVRLSTDPQFLDAHGHKRSFSSTNIKSDLELSEMLIEGEYGEEEEEDSWSSSSKEQLKTVSNVSKEKSSVSKGFVKSNYSIKSLKSIKSTSRHSKSRVSARSLTTVRSGYPMDPASSQDDLEVHFGGVQKKTKHRKNPFYEMLYCCESEADMIKWNSKYKKKEFEVSASDEFSKRAEIKTKQIARDFFDWWSTEGSAEYRGEIKRPSDIEDLFQVWFDEHASRGLMIHPKIIPCVLPGIANSADVPQASCPNALDRQVDWDILAERTPEFKTAFSSSLPKDLVHLPPNNNTIKQWRSLVIPEDLRTMSCVWEDIMHLTSTKSFKAYLKADPTLKMPLCLADKRGTVLKKQPFVIPSDYVMGADRKSVSSSQDLALPVSELTIEMKDVLEKLMNQ